MKLNEIHSLSWESAQSHLFLNPKLPKDHIENIFAIVKRINQPKHIYLATSGSSSTTQQYKLVALSKNAFLNSSRAVNALFSVDSHDVLLNLLPIFHVGGLSLFSRSFCSGAKLVDIWNENFKWNPFEFVNICHETKSTMTSLVPTQIFDLVSGRYKSPPTLRCIFVGGGSLSPDLFHRSQALGWNLYPTYGMTECCSQVATMAPGTIPALPLFPLSILPHLKVSIDENSCINISGSSLLSYYVNIKENHFEISDPTVNRTLITQDIGKLHTNNTLTILGRMDDNIKINAEFVNLLNVNHAFEKSKETLNIPFESTIIALPHARTGSHLVAVLLKKDMHHNAAISNLQLHYNTQVMPYERIHTIAFVESIPRTELGKIKINLLKQNVLTNLQFSAKL